MTLGNHICGPKLPAKLVFWNFGQQTFSYALLILRGVSNEDNTTFIIHVIFFRGCVPVVVVPSCAVGFLHIPKNLGFEYSIAVQAYDVRIYSSTLWADGGIRVFAHQITLLSWLCRPIWRYWTCHVTVSSVCLRFSQFSQLSFMQYMGLCLLSSPIPLIIVRICILYLIIIIKSDLWSIFHCLGLGHETMVCAA